MTKAVTTDCSLAWASVLLLQRHQWAAIAVVADAAMADAAAEAEAVAEAAESAAELFRCQTVAAVAVVQPAVVQMAVAAEQTQVAAAVQTAVAAV